MSHCLVWGRTHDGDLTQGCPHCGYQTHTWPSLSDKDDDRVKESQKNHREKCPGQSCTRRGRR